MTATEKLCDILEQRRAKWVTDGTKTIALAQGFKWVLTDCCDGYHLNINCEGEITPEAFGEDILDKLSEKNEHSEVINQGHIMEQPDEVYESCSRCHYRWHRSKFDRRYSYCPNCRRKLVYNI